MHTNKNMGEKTPTGRGSPRREVLNCITDTFILKENCMIRFVCLPIGIKYQLKWRHISF